MTLGGRLRAARLAATLERAAGRYAGATADAEREAYQLEALNHEWGRVTRSVPYYRERLERSELPERFDSLDAFVAGVPPVDRSAVQRDLERMTSSEAPPQFVRMTGGATSAPVRLPAWESENDRLRPTVWVGRSWYGITPASRCFMVWGHSHLLGSGWQGRLNRIKRGLTDRLLGYHRFSAYDLRPEKMREAGDALLRFRPEWVLGYSVALDALARANGDRADAFRALGLRAIVATAEAFPTDASAGLLERLFGCPVALEYGAVETNVMAHTTPEDGSYRVFWGDYLLEAERVDTEFHLLRVTSLYPRCFPLVRYELGDEIEPSGSDGRHVVSLDRFRRVVGRCNDYLLLPDGARVHSEAFSHVLRMVPAVRGFQVVQRGDRVRVRYTSNAALPDAAQREILERLSRIDAQLGAVHLERVERLEHTVAGKTRMIVVEP